MNTLRSADRGVFDGDQRQAEWDRAELPLQPARQLPAVSPPTDGQG
jgi:hypothetical protein